MDCRDTTCSRGRHLQIDTTNSNKHTVQLVRDYRSPHDLTSVIFGSMQSLQDSSNYTTSDFWSVLLGWGVHQEFGEYTNQGDLVRDVQYSPLKPGHSFVGGGSVSSYRVFKQSWHGYPTWPPSLAVGNDSKIWVSWNGATEVRIWAVYACNTEASLGLEEGSWKAPEAALVGLKPLTTVRRQGFETGIVIGAWASAFVKVAALDGEGNVIGVTQTTRIRSDCWSAVGWGCVLQDAVSFVCLIRLLI